MSERAYIVAVAVLGVAAAALWLLAWAAMFEALL
jgi:hypothetical protein